MNSDEEELQKVLALFPQLAHAVPPAPLAPPSPGLKRWNIAEDFAALAERARIGDFTLPTTDIGQLAGPFRAKGDCLSPVFQPGDWLWFDPTTPAQDNDFCLIEWSEAALARIMEARTGKAWLAKYGSPPGPIATKLFRHIAGEPWIVCNETGQALGGSRILGVLRHATRGGRRLYASAVPIIAQIGDNAATEILTATVSSQNVGFAPTAVITINDAVNFAHTAIVTAVFDMNINAGVLGGAAYIYSTLYATGTPVASIAQVQGLLRFTIQKEYSVAVGDFPDFKLFAYSADATGTRLTVSNASLQVEIIKK